MVFALVSRQKPFDAGQGALLNPDSLSHSQVINRMRSASKVFRIVSISVSGIGSVAPEKLTVYKTPGLERTGAFCFASKRQNRYPGNAALCTIFVRSEYRSCARYNGTKRSKPRFDKPKAVEVSAPVRTLSAYHGRSCCELSCI
jgi:hypothetical protein